MTIEKKKERILVVDDSAQTLELIRRNLELAGYQVFTAKSVAEAIRYFEANPVDLVITDLKMPEVSGMDLIKHIRDNYTDTEVMMITGYPSVESAVEAVKTGAEEYLTKPFTDDELFSSVRRTLDKLHIRRAGQARLQKIASAPYGLIGESAAMHKVFNMIAKASSTSATVLITGESGTGKELVARAIHYSSSRASAQFVPVNCVAIPGELLESELFGHVKGAFTGAIESRAGFFQTADGGTIFLDEISDTSLMMQAKLLRVLQDKEVCMVGSSNFRKVDVRILAATNKDLLGLVKKGIFREDLYYRLNVITIDLPPLRDRGNDILFLINYLVNKFGKDLEKPVPRFSESALQALRNYHWPGNVRELENVVQRLVVMTDSEIIETSDLPSLMRFSALTKIGFNRTLAEVELEYIQNVLSSVDGNRTKAAQILGIDRKTLRDRLKKPTDK